MYAASAKMILKSFRMLPSRRDTLHGRLLGLSALLYAGSRPWEMRHGDDEKTGVRERTDQ